MVELPTVRTVVGVLRCWRGATGLTLSQIEVRYERGAVPQHVVSADFMRGTEKVGEAEVRYTADGAAIFDRIRLDADEIGKGAMQDMLTTLQSTYRSWGLDRAEMGAHTKSGAAFANAMGFQRQGRVWVYRLPDA